jgi:Bacterial capsule synthesis protein PGA_cap
VKRLPLALVIGMIVLSLAVGLSGGLPGESASPTDRPGASAVAVAPRVSASPAEEPAPTASPTDASPTDDDPSAAPTAAPPSPTVTAAVSIVPVAQFRTTRTSTNHDEVAAVLAGKSSRYEALELVGGDATAILAALDLDEPGDPSRLILAADADTLATDLAAHRKRLGIVRADEVTAGVRALAWGKTALFGSDRVRDVGDWPLTASLDVPADGSRTFDPSATWTMFAGGDILLDRGVYETVRVKGRGVDFPFDGGTAEITSRYCCSSFGWELPRTARTGNDGAVRRVITGADLAIANFENPAPNKVRWHTKGTVFSADPGIIDGLVDAGIDYVGIANNHIGDAGKTGITQTIANLKKRGLAYSGAGKNEAAARTPAMLEVGGQTVAVLAYDRIARYYFASKDTAGSAPLSVKRVTADIKKARANGADVVIVFPHWGTEYQDGPFAAQQTLAHDIIDAGADMIIGNHAHWAAAMEVYAGKPIWYALGNFVFDQTWSEPTMEGITLELTFHGSELVQVRIRPHIILDKAQPNFLDPAGDGKVVMGQVFDASKGLLPW